MPFITFPESVLNFNLTSWYTTTSGIIYIIGISFFLFFRLDEGFRMYPFRYNNLPWPLLTLITIFL